MIPLPPVGEWLVVFFRAPQLGRVKTRLARALGEEAALEIYCRLVEHTVRVVMATGYPTIFYYAADALHEDVWTEARLREWLIALGGEKSWELRAQVSGDLGQRLHVAMEEVFIEKKATATVFIGTDAWTLATSHLEEAFASLCDHEVVIGPAKDGGYYLLGMTEMMPELFQDIPWSTDNTREVTQQRAVAAGRRVAALLEELIDVDEAGDWTTVRGER